MLTLRALTTVAIHWVPGHSLIYGNEVADLLAKRGADVTTCSSMPDFPTLIDLIFAFSTKCKSLDNYQYTTHSIQFVLVIDTTYKLNRQNMTSMMSD